MPMKQDDLSLTKAQYDHIMQMIVHEHRFGLYPSPKHHKYIKYIRPNWDMRDGKCFSISFDDVTFDFRESDVSMYSRITNWLLKEN